MPNTTESTIPFEKTGDTASPEMQDKVRASRADPTLSQGDRAKVAAESAQNIKNRVKMAGVRGSKKNRGLTQSTADGMSSGVDTSKAYAPVDMSKFGPSTNVPKAAIPAKSNVVTDSGDQNPVSDSEVQDSTGKPKFKMPNLAKVGQIGNLALGALSGFTGFAAKMGDVSRKILQGALNPSPIGTTEMNNTLNGIQGVAGAAQGAVSTVSDLQKQHEADKKALAKNKEFDQFQDLEKIRGKYVNKLNAAPMNSDWGDIAREYEAEIRQYLKDQGLDPTKMDKNGILAKQINRTAREMANIGQRKKSQNNIVNTQAVLDAQRIDMDARKDSAAAKQQLKDIKKENLYKIDDILKNGTDAKGNVLSNEDKAIFDFMIENGLDDAAANYTVGGRFDVDTNRKMADLILKKAAETTDANEKRLWQDRYYKFQNAVNDDYAQMDEYKYHVKDAYISNPNISLVDKVKHMNLKKDRGYELQDIDTINKVGFVPNKNLIKDARFVLDRTEQGIINQRAKINANTTLSPAERQKQLQVLDQQQAQLNYDRAKLTPAFMLADVHANVFEKLERTVPGKKYQMVPQYIRGADGQDMTGAQWFDAVRRKSNIVVPTTENAKAALYSEIYNEIAISNQKLNQAWADYQNDLKTNPNAKFEGLETKLFDTNGDPILRADGEQATIASEMQDKVAKALSDYDTSLNLLHISGTIPPANLKEVAMAVGLTATQIKNLNLGSINGTGGQPPAGPTGGQGQPLPQYSFFDPKKIVIVGSNGKNIRPIIGRIMSKNGRAFFDALATNKVLSDSDKAKVAVTKYVSEVQKSPVFQKAVASLRNPKAYMASVEKAIKEVMGPNPTQGAKNAVLSFYNLVNSYNRKHGNAIVIDPQLASVMPRALKRIK